MKKILCKIGDFFETLFAMIVAVIFGVCVVFLLPLDYIKYKRSLYYKTEHKKYKLYAASGINFEIYNEIIKNDLPIKFILTQTMIHWNMVGLFTIIHLSFQTFFLLNIIPKRKSGIIVVKLLKRMIPKKEL